MSNEVTRIGESQWFQVLRKSWGNGSFPYAVVAVGPTHGPALFLARKSGFWNRLFRRNVVVTHSLDELRELRDLLDTVIEQQAGNPYP